MQNKQQWKKHAKQMDNMRQSRRNEFWQVIKEFRRLGFEVREITPYQFRFNDCLDIYPSNKRYHELAKRSRGDIRGKSFDQFLREFFGIK